MSRALSYFSKRVFQQQKIILFFGTKIISLLNCFFLWDAESMQWVQWIFLSWSVQKFIPSIQTIHPLKRMSKFFLSRAEIFLPYQPFDNWISIQTFHPLEQMSRFLCQGKNQCFYFSLLLTALWLFVYWADKLLPFFHMTFEKIILINTEQRRNNTLNLSLFSLGKGLILSYGFRELSYGTSISDAKLCIFGVFKSKTFI